MLKFKDDYKEVIKQLNDAFSQEPDENKNSSRIVYRKNIQKRNSIEEDYKDAVQKLACAFEKKQEDEKKKKLELFDRMTTEKEKFIENIPYEELKKISDKVCSKITNIRYLTEAEKLLLEEIKRGKKLKYKQVVYHLTGNIDKEKIMKNYVELLRSEHSFCTNYLYKGLKEPVRVVCEQKETTFPIHDIRELHKNKQIFVVKNVLAAEMRREYDIENDATLRVRGYLTADNEMMVVISLYPYFQYLFGFKEIIYKIFDGLKPRSSQISAMDEKMLQRLNDKLKEQSINHWKEMLLPKENIITIPGESKRVFGNTLQKSLLLYKELGEEFIQKLTAFCESQQVSFKAVFLFAWGNLLGRYHNTKKITMAVTQSKGNMNVFPVRADVNCKLLESLRDIDTQLKQSVKYSDCTIHDVEKETGIVFHEYFRMLHNFMEFSELDTIGENTDGIKEFEDMNAGDAEINLSVDYHLYDNNIGIQYTSRGGIMEIVLDNLHELFLDELSNLLVPEQEKFNKHTFIKLNDTDEEKLYKLQIAQIALYLKESGIFESITVDEIMKLAEYCQLSTRLMDDIVVSEKSRTSSIYIVGEGKLEESLTANDGIVKSLRIIKKGSIFGMESLFEKDEAKTAYTVVSQQAKIVEIDKEILIEVFRRNPQGWIALLKKENEQKFRLQRLWTME